MVETDTLRTA